MTAAEMKKLGEALFDNGTYLRLIQDDFLVYELRCFADAHINDFTNVYLDPNYTSGITLYIVDHFSSSRIYARLAGVNDPMIYDDDVKDEDFVTFDELFEDLQGMLNDPRVVVETKKWRKV